MDDLRNRLNDCKAVVKGFEKGFQKEHGHLPKRADMPQLIVAAYEDYKALRKKLEEVEAGSAVGAAATAPTATTHTHASAPAAACPTGNGSIPVPDGSSIPGGSGPAEPPVPHLEQPCAAGSATLGTEAAGARVVKGGGDGGGARPVAKVAWHMGGDVDDVDLPAPTNKPKSSTVENLGEKRLCPDAPVLPAQVNAVEAKGPPAPAAGEAPMGAAAGPAAGAGVGGKKRSQRRRRAMPSTFDACMRLFLNEQASEADLDAIERKRNLFGAEIQKIVNVSLVAHHKKKRQREAAARRRSTSQASESEDGGGRGRRKRGGAVRAGVPKRGRNIAFLQDDAEVDDKSTPSSADEDEDEGTGRDGGSSGSGSDGDIKCGAKRWASGGKKKGTSARGEEAAARKAVLSVIEQCALLEQRLHKDEQAAEALSSSAKASIDAQLASIPLKPYQAAGVHWLLRLHRHGLSGMLGDEMGLGKTIQTVAFMTALIKQQPVGPQRQFLVVAPGSLLENWRNEVKRWSPQLRPVIYHGSLEERQELRERLLAERDSFDVLVTTYSLFERDSEVQQADRAFFRKFQFHHLVLDEAHSLKVMTTQRYKNLARLRADNRLLLTGTPLQNNLGELLTLLSFLMPSLFDKKNKDLCALFAASVTNASVGGADAGGGDLQQEEFVAKVKQVLSPFLLRRVKADVLDQMVPKSEVLVRLPLAGAQLQLYRDALREVQRKTLLREGGDVPKGGADASGKASGADAAAPAPGEAARSADTAVSGSGVASSLAGGTDETIGAKSGAAGQAAAKGLRTSLARARELVSRMQAASVSNMFVHLRKLANHPMLIRSSRFGDEVLPKIAHTAWAAGEFGDSCSEAKVLEELQGYNDLQLHLFCKQCKGLRKYCAPEEALTDSAKLRHLRALLPTLQQNGDRVLIFSQWTQILDLIEITLQTMGIKYCRLDGSTEMDQRQTLVDDFNADDSITVFLLSTRAGGMGLNLTGANTVIIHDVDFNPQVDRQAIDRSHRIGQTRPVRVLRLVAECTVDESIFKVSERKRRLDKAILEGTPVGASGAASAADASIAEGEAGATEAEEDLRAGSEGGGEQGMTMAAILAEAIAGAGAEMENEPQAEEADTTKATPSPGTADDVTMAEGGGQGEPKPNSGTVPDAMAGAEDSLNGVAATITNGEGGKAAVDAMRTETSYTGSKVGLSAEAASPARATPENCGSAGCGVGDRLAGCTEAAMDCQDAFAVDSEGKSMGQVDVPVGQPTVETACNESWPASMPNTADLLDALKG